MSEKLNTLRAGVLGSNDGILTVVGVLFSVAVATPNIFTIFIAGLSDLLACAFSMASGEYASVSSQRDAESSAVANEQVLLKNNIDEEIESVKEYYMSRGISEETSTEIARELLNKKPLETVVNTKYGIQLGHYMNPWHAAFSSLISAAAGGVFPLLAMSLIPGVYRWPGTIGAVVLSVALTGYLSAKLGDGLVKTAVVRNIVIGILTMIIHYTLGKLMNQF
ncbi:VIT1/CCC1 transporter family protein [Apilactobacillus xinyiensis]|uniref:VIT family protein n=1 Tax=Apilactobacillus xinyiensis TaxID=2841032 RepID=A0ABT0I0S5_9LACO|nr:VIT family protein [Apilactobacillus xinyiensis]MCK8624441.1 VIT family protein [Apilactobacillus xinyiensis]MCL0312034.1 VIT family protein [Apilactobacillus xinyiensis]MCL0318692.1 VIT family protein [Apilactobacillus xinyiensis]MCL0329568.1 VIT family protein [Apilactobacillus xinyiensis]